MTTVAAVAGVGIVGALLLGLSNRQKTVIEQGKLSTRVWQGSEYGGDIPRMYGTVALEGSQIVWLEHNKLKEKVKKKKSGGKGGGGSTTTKIYTYFATFALMLCQGEVAGVRRIWCGDKLIYNAGSDDLETIIASNQAAKGWKLYTGTDDQLPDPRYEADVGVGNAPAFRGYTYIVFNDFALADYSNTLQAAQFKVELVRKNDAGSGLIASRDLRLNEGPYFLPQPFYVDEEKIVIYAPGWNNTYVSPSYVDKFVITPGGGYYDSRQGVADVGGAVPPSGTDDLGNFYKDFSSIFPTYSGIDPQGVNGHFRLRGNYCVFLVTLGGGTVGFGQARGLQSLAVPTYNTISVPGKAVDVYGDGFFVATNTGISLYDSSMTKVAEILHTFSAGAGARLYVADNALYYYEGDSTSKVYEVDFGLTYVREFITLTPAPGIWSVEFAVHGSVVVRVYVNGHTPWMARGEWFNADLIRPDKESLGDIVKAECSLSNLIEVADLDVSLLSQEVTGYRVSGGTIRSVIEPLQGAYPFDVVPSGYKIKFVPRGQAPVVTIPWEDLAATNGDEIGDSLPYSREMDSQLPQKVTITALSSTREYGAATQYYERMNTSAVNIEQRDIPLVLSDDEIAQMAEKLLFLRWLERDDFSYSLPPTYMALEPSDVVTVQAQFGTFELRQTEVNYEDDGRLTCKAKANSATLYISRAVGAPAPGPDGTIPLNGPSILLNLDIPVIDETVQNDPGFVGVMTGPNESWPGGVEVRSSDDGQTWIDIQAFIGHATLGTALTTLPSSGCTVIDMRSLRISSLSGSWESITRAQMLSGVNYAAYGVDGRWEIVRFQNAALQSDGSYLLSGFIRGDRGTEWATGLHQIGDYFVLLDDPDNAFIGMAIGSIGVPAIYRGVTSGASIDSASDIPFTYRGVNLECLSPVSARGNRDTSGNFTGNFTRRTRLSSSWWTNGISGPVGEASEAYEIDVMSGSTVKRTISVSSPTWTYSAANQTTDFGSAKAAITFRIFQISNIMGRGYPLEVTL
ncbi:phage tail protein [Pseudomonas citronellolis]|uniref:phage tail protein n=1 Tax=Pseudomonas citronellolis TaxID=53408 RepID=UPI002FD986BD